jgi:small neutral amino acid transporter SnatA (MarC family)
VALFAIMNPITRIPIFLSLADERHSGSRLTMRRRDRFRRHHRRALCAAALRMIVASLRAAFNGVSG